MITPTQTDLLIFERKLRAAARQQSEIEVNVRNARRGYILFANWHPDYADATPQEFASNKISLVLDGAAGIARL